MDEVANWFVSSMVVDIGLETITNSVMVIYPREEFQGKLKGELREKESGKGG